MNLFNDIGKKTSDIKNKITEETKLRMTITKNKDKIEMLYTELGKRIYEKHINDSIEGLTEEINARCREIDEIADIIEEANKKMLKIKNKKQCHKCYSELQMNAKYCDQCGVKQGYAEKEDIIVEEKAEGDNE